MERQELLQIMEMQWTFGHFRLTSVNACYLFPSFICNELPLRKQTYSRVIFTFFIGPLEIRT